MLTNYLKVALRSILRNKLTAFINIAGLALAITCALMIYLYVTDELSYDRYHSKSDRIYRITRDFLSEDGTVNLRLANVAPPIGPLIKNDFGEVEAMARTANFGFNISIEENNEQKKVFNEENLFLAEPDILKIFDIGIQSGNPANALDRPFTVMLSEKTAKRYFNDTQVVGKRLRANAAYDLEVTGVYQDFPAESHWHPDLLVSFSTLNDTTVYGKRAWKRTGGITLSERMFYWSRAQMLQPSKANFRILSSVILARSRLPTGARLQTSMQQKLRGFSLNRLQTST